MASPLSGARVLVAEDSAVNREVAAFFLEDLGCRAKLTGDGAEAVAQFKAHAFDYVLMDCQMPVMDGFKALVEMRTLESRTGRPRTPVIAVTAADDEAAHAACRQAGFDGFLAKPFTVDGLRAALLNRAIHPDHAAASPALAEPATLDLAILRAFVADFGADTASSLIGSFVNLLHESAPRVDTATASQDTHQLRATAHKLAGAAGMAGAARLAQLARATETDCKQKPSTWPLNSALLRAAIVAALAAFEPLSDGARLADRLAHPQSNPPAPHSSHPLFIGT